MASIHAAQSVVEFREIIRRHGTTPIGWLESLGVLDARMIVSHAIFLDQHSWIRWPDHEDLGRLVSSGCSGGKWVSNTAKASPIRPSCRP